MGIKVGDVDLVNEIVELEYQVNRLQLIIQALIDKNPETLSISPSTIKDIDDRSIEKLQKKYPNMGIKKK